MPGGCDARIAKRWARELRNRARSCWTGRVLLQDQWRSEARHYEKHSRYVSGLDMRMKWQGNLDSISSGKGAVPVST